MGGDGHLMPRLGSQAVTHRTPHTERWGGWFVTSNSVAPPYNPLGHLGNLTVAEHPGSGPAIVSDRVFVEWLASAPETRGYLSSSSDIASLMVFDHQMHGMNLLTRLNWESRLTDGRGHTAADVEALAGRVGELVDYFLFVGEAPLAVAVAPRPGFAGALAARTPKDGQGR